MEQPNQRLSFEPPRYTYEDYKKWSDEWELIEGYPYSLMPSPKHSHQRFSRNFTVAVQNSLEGKGCKCELYYEFDWIINNETIVRPDGMIVCGEIKTDWLTFAPSLILEIASDSTYLKDKNVKFKVYEFNKVKYYLLIDPVKQKAECYELVDSFYQMKKDNIFYLDNKCEIEIDFTKMW